MQGRSRCPFRISRVRLCPLMRTGGQHVACRNVHSHSGVGPIRRWRRTPKRLVFNALLCLLPFSLLKRRLRPLE